ncbi:SDR family NAD(P)-dependent oxidoreductase [Kribbella sp. NPDC049227]|uniref:SDR family NAD(P)-dependent oxidoreductase n=1 Tax=Kribbella sp. NPDC049227 TaxID=3364113 RepID=UPI00371601DE
MKRLDGRIAVVVGAESGTGRQLAETFAGEGAYVVRVHADRTSEEQLAEVFGQVAGELGRVDLLSNALRAPEVADASEKQWDHAMAVNVTTAFLAMKHAVPLMPEAGGSVVNVSTAGSARDVASAASMAALNHLTRVTAAEYAPRQIRVNTVLADRLATPVDVAQAALFLAGDGAGFVTGVELVVGGVL